MKSIKGHISTFALGALLFFQSNAEAMPRMWRSTSGNVDRVYQDRNTIILITDEQKKVMLITWKERTRVYRNGKRVDDFALQEGSHVSLNYRTSLFGERWATKIVLTDVKEGSGKVEEFEAEVILQNFQR